MRLGPRKSALDCQDRSQRATRPPPPLTSRPPSKPPSPGQGVRLYCPPYTSDDIVLPAPSDHLYAAAVMPSEPPSTWPRPPATRFQPASSASSSPKSSSSSTPASASFRRQFLSRRNLGFDGVLMNTAMLKEQVQFMVTRLLALDCSGLSRRMLRMPWRLRSAISILRRLCCCRERPLKRIVQDGRCSFSPAAMLHAQPATACDGALADDVQL